MKGLILNNAYNISKTYLNQSIRLKEEFDKLKIAVDIRRNDFFPATITNGEIESIVKEYDFCVYLDKDKYVARLLEKAGLKLFNKSSSMEVCDDKMATHIALAQNCIPMPKTIPGLLCYSKEQPIKEETVNRIRALVDFPIIIKESYGSLGKGVYKATTESELKKIMEEIRCVPHLFQEFIRESYGKDIRVIVIGNKVVASMMRKSQGDFRSNAELGGNAFVCDLPQDYIDLSEKVSKILELDYCGIDILVGKNDAPSICEVNSNAFWGKIEQVTNSNVAKTYALHILNNLN